MTTSIPGLGLQRLWMVYVCSASRGL